MNNKPLRLAIVDALMMLEYSPDDQLDPDLAVKTMESMGASLQQLSHYDQLELTRIIMEIAEESEGGDSRFISSVPEMMGLAISPDPTSASMR